MTHILKVWWWRVNFIEFPLRATLSFECWVKVTSYEAVGWQSQGMEKVWGDLARWWCQSPHKGPGTLEVPPVKVPGSSDELVTVPVMMAASRSGAPVAQRRMALSVTAGILVQIATRIWTFSSCAHINFSFWRRRTFVFWKRRIQERKVMLVMRQACPG